MKEGHKVFVSEYNAPDDFVSVWEKELRVNMSSTKTKQDLGNKAVEKLFVHKSQIEDTE